MSNYYGRKLTVMAGVKGAEVAVKLFGQRVVFDVERTSKRVNNTAKIKIFNISEVTKKFFTAPKSSVKLIAGYQTVSGVIFTGSVESYSEGRDGADRYLELECSEGADVLRKPVASFSMSGVVQPQQVINRIATLIQLPVNIAVPIASKPYQSGFSAYGNPFEILEKVCRKIKYNYSVENGMLNLWPSAGSMLDTIPLISAKTGLVGEPERIKVDNKSGWRVRMLMNALVTPAGRFSVVSKSLNSTLKSKKVVFSGDTHGDEWTTTVEGVSV